MVLAEKNHYPGGVATSGLMCSMSNYFLTRDGAQVTTGLPIEFVDRLVREGGAMAGYLRPTQPQIPNDPEVVKRVMIEMLRESEVRTLYGSLLCDVVMEGDTIQACVFQARDQSFAVTARQFVDASGDLAVIRRAGGRYVEKDDGSTLLNRMANVDIDRIIDWFEAHPDSYSPAARHPHLAARTPSATGASTASFTSRTAAATRSAWSGRRWRAATMRSALASTRKISPVSASFPPAATGGRC